MRMRKGGDEEREAGRRRWQPGTQAGWLAGILCLPVSTHSLEGEQLTHELKQQSYHKILSQKGIKKLKHNLWEYGASVEKYHFLFLTMLQFPNSFFGRVFHSMIAVWAREWVSCSLASEWVETGKQSIIIVEVVILSSCYLTARHGAGLQPDVDVMR